MEAAEQEFVRQSMYCADSSNGGVTPRPLTALRHGAVVGEAWQFHYLHLEVLRAMRYLTPRRSWSTVGPGGEYEWRCVLGARAVLFDSRNDADVDSRECAMQDAEGVGKRHCLPFQGWLDEHAGEDI